MKTTLVVLVIIGLVGTAQAGERSTYESTCSLHGCTSSFKSGSYRSDTTSTYRNGHFLAETHSYQVAPSQETVIYHSELTEAQKAQIRAERPGPHEIPLGR
jgi:hypothetical protein